MGRSTTIADMLISLGVDPAKLQKGLDRAKRDLDSFESAVVTLDKKLNQLFSIAGAAALASSIQSIAKETIHATNQIAYMAEQTSTSSQEFSKWNYAAKMVNLNSEQLATGMKTLEKHMSDAIHGSKQQQKQFEAHGISVKFLKEHQNDLGAVLDVLTDKFSHYRDSVNKTESGVAFLGRSGEKMLRIFDEGTGKLAEWKREAESIGEIVTPEMAKQTQQLERDWTKLSSAISNATRSLILYGNAENRKLGKVDTLPEIMERQRKEGAGRKESDRAYFIKSMLQGKGDTLGPVDPKQLPESLRDNKYSPREFYKRNKEILKYFPKDELVAAGIDSSAIDEILGASVDAPGPSKAGKEHKPRAHKDHRSIAWVNELIRGYELVDRQNEKMEAIQEKIDERKQKFQRRESKEGLALMKMDFDNKTEYEYRFQKQAEEITLDNLSGLEKRKRAIKDIDNLEAKFPQYKKQLEIAKKNIGTEYDFMTDKAKEAGDNISSILAENIMSGFKNGIGGLLKEWGMMLARMAVMAASQELIKGIFNASGLAGLFTSGWSGAGAVAAGDAEGLIPVLGTAGTLATANMNTAGIRDIASSSAALTSGGGNGRQDHYHHFDDTSQKMYLKDWWETHMADHAATR